ncbi:MAG TPA: hypothetical protein VHZ97_03045 [Pseudonocardiaceae bacterium]|nr:hypothetical protein [Pseudonocardiaceae bacterium]
MSAEETAQQAEQPTQLEPETWGTPLPHGAGKVEVPTQVEMRPHWSARKVIGAVVLAVVIVGGGTAAAIAATQPASTADAHPSLGVSGGQVTGGNGGGSHRGAGGYTGGAPLGNAVHGDFVVRTDAGGYATERVQTGKVTKLGSATLTVTSTDHYVSNYLLNASTVINRGAITIDAVKPGDTVNVIATLTGSTATATTITDLADKQFPTTHPGTSSGTGGMQPNDTTSPNPGN